AQKSKISDILTNLQAISNNFKNNNEQITQIFANLQTVTDNAARLNFTETMAKADQAVADFQSIANEIQAGKGSIGKLLNDEALYQHLADASKSLDELIVDMKERPGRYVHFSV